MPDFSSLYEEIKQVKVEIEEHEKYHNYWINVLQEFPASNRDAEILQTAATAKKDFEDCNIYLFGEVRD